MPGLRSLMARRKYTIASTGNPEDSIKSGSNESSLTVNSKTYDQYNQEGPFTSASQWTLESIFNMTQFQHSVINPSQSSQLSNEKEAHLTTNESTHTVKSHPSTESCDQESEMVLNMKVVHSNAFQENRCSDTVSSNFPDVKTPTKLTETSLIVPAISSNIPTIESSLSTYEMATSNSNEFSNTEQEKLLVIKNTPSIVQSKLPVDNNKSGPISYQGLLKVSSEGISTVSFPSVKPATSIPDNAPCSVFFTEPPEVESSTVSCPKCTMPYEPEKISVNIERKIAQFICDTCDWIVLKEICQHSISIN